MGSRTLPTTLVAEVDELFLLAGRGCRRDESMSATGSPLSPVALL